MGLVEGVALRRPRPSVVTVARQAALAAAERSQLQAVAQRRADMCRTACLHYADYIDVAQPQPCRPQRVSPRRP